MSGTMTDSLKDMPHILPAPERLAFNYVRRPGLWKIMFTNLFMGIITLTIWHFWGKTNVRKHIWSCIHINGEPLEYTGRGGELFRGFMLVFVIFILPILLLTGWLLLSQGPDTPAIKQLNLVFFAAGYLLSGFALYKARNYQLSRTNWRGIRGNMAGSAGIYSLTYFGNILAKWFSLGWATPVMNVVMSEQMIGDMRFGDASFKFKGRAGPLYPTYALCWFLTLFLVFGGGIFFAYELASWLGPNAKDALDHVFKTANTVTPSPNDFVVVGYFFIDILSLLFLYILVIPALWAIYSAKELRTLANYSRFDGAQFKLNATWANVIWLAVGNFLIVFIAILIGIALISVIVFGLNKFGLDKSTLGIIAAVVAVLLVYQSVWALSRPLITQRNIAFIIKRLKLEGAIDVARIRQSVAARPTRGEGLADAFDLGAW
jgi:uncharacterized membrane protein YjgN (DUF898 family)